MKMSKVEGTMRLALAFAEAFNQHDAARMAAVLSEDCTYETSTPAPSGTTCQGKAAIAQYWHNFFQTYPTVQIEIEDLFGYGYRSIMRWRYIWAEKETGLRGIDIFQVKNGAINAQYSYVKEELAKT